MRNVLLVLALVPVLLLAGCTGGGKNDTTKEPPGSTIEATPGSLEGAGTVTGSILDDASLPIEGATVALAELGIQVLSDAAGGFGFTNVPPGDYRLIAQKLGYESVARKVSVAEAQDVTASLVMVPIAIQEAYHEIIGPYTGFMTCGFVATRVPGVVGGQALNCGNLTVQGQAPLGVDKNSFTFKLAESEYDSIVGETKWQSSAVGTSSQLQTLFRHTGSTGTHWWCSAAGASPIKFVYSSDEARRVCASDQGQDEPSQSVTLRMNTILPFFSAGANDPAPAKATFQQKFDSVVTIFYGEQPEPTWSALGDA